MPLASLALGALLAAAGLFACRPGGTGSSARPVRPDVLLITLDTVRADHLGCYGHARPTSPGIDRIAAGGALFAVAYAPTPATSPSHASLMTARHPIAHGLVRNGLRLGGGEVTLAEILAREGYRTAAFVSSFPVSSRFGFDQGFDHFDDDFPAAGDTHARAAWGGEVVEGGFDRRGGATAGRFIDWLAREGSARPLFAWIHLFDPHWPYVPPPDYARRFLAPEMGRRERLVARYDAEILYADAQIARTAEAMEGRRSDRELLLVITGDHGEGLHARGWLEHNRSTFDEEVRVPLILRWRGRVPPGRRLEQPAHLIDVVPTLLGLLGLERAGLDLHGVDLSPHLLRDRPPDAERPLFLQRPFHPPGSKAPEPGWKGWGLGLRRGDWKYFEAREEDRRELYDLASDPAERRNLAASLPERAEALSELLADWRRRFEAPDRVLSVPESAREGLESLGYLGDEAPE